MEKKISDKQILYLESLVRELGYDVFEKICRNNLIDLDYKSLSIDKARILINALLKEKNGDVIIDGIKIIGAVKILTKEEVTFLGYKDLRDVAKENGVYRSYLETLVNKGYFKSHIVICGNYCNYYVDENQEKYITYKLNQNKKVDV